MQWHEMRSLCSGSLLCHLGNVCDLMSDPVKRAVFTALPQPALLVLLHSESLRADSKALWADSKDSVLAAVCC